MASVPKPRTELNASDASEARAAWNAYRKAQSEAEAKRRTLVRVLAKLHKRYPVASIARAVKVTPPAVWNKLKG